MDIAAVDVSCDTAARAASPVRSLSGSYKGRCGSAAGVCICALVPAAFWCAVIWGIGHALGTVPNAATMATIGTVTAAFLTVIASAVMSNY